MSPFCLAMSALGIVGGITDRRVYEIVSGLADAIRQAQSQLKEVDQKDPE